MQQLWEFGGRAILIAFLCSAIVGAYAGWAIASYGRYSRVLGAVVGALTSLPGLVVLLIVSLVRVNAEKIADARAATEGRAVSVPEATGGFSAFSSASDDSTTGFGAAAFSTSGMAAAQPTPGAGFGSYDGAESYGSFDAVPFHSEVPVAPAGTAPRDAARRFDWVRGRAGLLTVGLAVASVLLIAATLLAAWLSVDAAIIPRFWVFAIGTGLDVAVLATIILCGVAVVFVAVRPFRWAAVLLAVVAQSWLFFALMTMSARESVTRVLTEVGALSLTVGDTLTALGVRTTGERIELPPEVDLSALGISGTSIDINAVELGAAIPDVTVDLGPAIYMLVAFAIIANIAAFLILKAAHTAEPWRRRGSAY